MWGIIYTILERLAVRAVDASVKKWWESPTAQPKRSNVRPIVSDWDTKLNEAFGDDFRVLRRSSLEPKLVYADDDEAFQPDAAMQPAIERHRERLANENKTNEPHLIVAPDMAPIWNADPPTIYVRRTDYATICAYRETQTPLKAISSCAVLICSDDRELILHKRSPKSDNAPNMVHIVGGAYFPGDPTDPHGNHKSVRKTILREVFEETNLFPKAEPETFVASQVDQEGWIQFTYLGLDIPRGAKTKIATNWEGDEVFVPFGEIETWLTREGLVENGRALILAWLAHGAPNGHAPDTLGKRQCRRLFEQGVDWVKGARPDQEQA